MSDLFKLLKSSFYGGNPTIDDLNEENNSSFNPVNTTVEDVDGMNNSSSNPINTTVQDEEEKKSSINEDKPIDNASSTPDIDGSIKGIASLSLESTAKPDDVQSIIETLTTFAVSNASLMQRHDALLLASAIMRIALDIFASHDQLENPFNSENIGHLLFKPESEHVPVALELLNWILYDKMDHSALTQKMNDDFDFLAALKSQYLVSRAQKDESVMQANANSSAGSESYNEEKVDEPNFDMQVAGRLSLVGRKFDVTLDEIRRRIGQPECLNNSILAGMLKINDTAKRARLMNKLAALRIKLPVGRRNQVDITALTALLEGEAIHLASDLKKITASYYPIDALVEYLRNKWTEGSHEVETLRRDLLGASRILREIRDVILFVGCPIGNKNPSPFHDEALQLAFNQYRLRTHGFGVLNQRTWIRQFAKLAKRTSLCYGDNSTMVDVDDENNSTLNAADKNITAADVDEKKSSINEGEPNDIGSSMTGIDTPIKGVASLSLESKAEKDESVMQANASSSSDSQTYTMQVHGCFSLNGFGGKPCNFDVTCDEIRRRIGEPECLNINTLTGMLKKINSAAKREELQKILKDWGIELPVGRKEGVNTAFTAFREGDAMHLASDLDKITASYYPIEALVEHLRNKWTEGSHDKVESRRRDLLGASRILREIGDVIFRVECPIGNHNPPPFHDETLQLAFNQYSLRTHGFGVLNQRTWIRQFAKLTECLSDKMTDTTASHV